ncbi:SemiSWEET transporter [Cupriavidus basilensis]|uniref:SemiSWEET transporter n=1 Tax=Cupriavidus basilensis TaxID=68895 RepID=A0ABT6AL36_9BURK|nr:SemiSWEET transporter [Cupriavidus basilensis]MDF3833316.1 SemiSWEET transporter [Cupriavidus basilensis]
MTIEDMVGLLAGCCTTVAFVPQLVKIWRSRSASDISYGMYLVFILGVVLWLGYGVAIGSRPMVLANAAVLAQAIAVVILKRRFKS